MDTMNRERDSPLRLLCFTSASLGGRTRFHGGLAISQARATHVEDNW